MDEKTARDKNYNVENIGYEGRSREEFTHRVISLFTSVNEGAVSNFKLLGLLVGISVSLCNSYSRNTALYRCVDNCSACASVCERISHLLSVMNRNTDKNRDAKEDYKCKYPVKRKKIYESEDECRDAYEKILRAVMRELADLEKIRGHSRHYLSRLVFVIEGERKSLNLSEEISSHRRLHSNTDKVAVILHEIAEEESYDIKKKHDACRDNDLLRRVASFKKIRKDRFGDDRIYHSYERDYERRRKIEK